MMALHCAFTESVNFPQFCQLQPAKIALGFFPVIRYVAAEVEIRDRALVEPFQLLLLPSPKFMYATVFGLITIFPPLRRN